MKYLVALTIFSVLVYGARRYAGVLHMSRPFLHLAFFKIHYLATGLVLGWLFPADFMLVVERVRVPVLLFGLTWIGLYYGCGLELRAHQRFRSRVVLFNIVEPAVVLIIIGLGGALYLYMSRGTWDHFSTAFTVSLFASFTIFRRRGIFIREGRISHDSVLDSLLPVGNILPVVALGFLGRVLEPDAGLALLGHTFTSPQALFFIECAIGVTGGMLLNMLISGSVSSEARIIILLGGTAFIGGIASSFSFSTLFTGAVAGAFLINATLKRLEVLDALNDVQDLVEKAFMFSLGTLLAPILPLLGTGMVAVVLAALALFAFRAALKYVLTTRWIASRDMAGDISPALWIGLTGQGTLASGAALECAYNVRDFTRVLPLLITLLVLNQVAIGVYLWYTGPDHGTREA